MQAEIILGEIAGAAADLAELLYAGGVNGDAGADCGAIAFGSDEFEKDAVIGVAIRVQKDGGRLANVQQDDVDIAVVEDGMAWRPASFETSSKVPSRLLRWRSMGSL